VLRHEILSSSNSTAATRPISSPEKINPLLKQEKPAGASKPAKSAPEDSIDHEKLEGLMKPPGDPAKK